MEYIGRIPVRNIWLLMLYASKIQNQYSIDRLSREENPTEIVDIVVEVLVHAVIERIRQHLTAGYRHRQEDLNRVRGKIDLLRTERRRLMDRGKVACQFEELTIDTYRNRYVRGALERASHYVKDADLKVRCKSLAHELSKMGVSSGAPDSRAIDSERFGMHDRHDEIMLTIARLIYEFAIPAREAGSLSLPDPNREDTWVRTLFEKAVGGFFKVVLAERDWNVSTGRRLDWQQTAATDDIPRLLPGMRTDISLDSLTLRRRIVIDTKFTSIVTKGHHRESSFKSNHIYQIYAYVRSQVRKEDIRSKSAEGVLLYPSIDIDVDEAVRIQDHVIRFKTVNLSGTIETIRRQLLEVVKTTPISDRLVA